MAHDAQSGPSLYGLLAEFDTPGQLLKAATKVREAGYTRTDAYSPFPIHGMSEALGIRERAVAPIVLAGGLTGLIVGYGLEYWTMVIAYPMNVGMWLERFVIIVTSLHRDFVPSSWEMYYPTIWDFMTLFGTIGLFTTLMFVFVRLLPMIAIFEMHTLLPQSRSKPAGEEATS